MPSEPMPYDRDIARLQIEPSQYTFPGDEMLSEAAYGGVMSNTYLRKLPFARMLMRRFSIPPSQEDAERIKRGLVCMGWLDHMLDEAPDKNASHALYEDLITSLSADAAESRPIAAWARPELFDSITLLKNSLSSLPVEQRTAITNKARRIGDISTLKATQTDARIYANTLSYEGNLSSDVVIECLGKQARRVAGYARLHAFNARAMAAATLLDAAIDLPQDFANGLTGVKPSFYNRAYLYARAFQHLPAVIRGLGLAGTFTMVSVGPN